MNIQILAVEVARSATAHLELNSRNRILLWFPLSLVPPLVSVYPPLDYFGLLAQIAIGAETQVCTGLTRNNWFAVFI